MSNQADFDFAARKIIEQGNPSIAPSGRCMYRGPNGLKCAIGHMIPDSDYYPDLEGGSACDDILGHLPSMAGKDFRLLGHIQIAHDDCSSSFGAEFVERFKYQMRAVARSYGLSDAVLDEVPLDQSKVAA